MTSEKTEMSWWFRQLPNSITVLRIVLVPVVLWLLLSFWDSWVGRLIALIVLVLSAATDGIDGGIARKFGIESDFGKLVDPIADKFLLSGALIALSWLDAVPWVATLLILGREVAITLFRFMVAKKRVIAANAGGKFKTVVQIVSISLVIVPLGAVFPIWNIIAQAAIWFAVIVTLVTGAVYLLPNQKKS